MILIPGSEYSTADVHTTIGPKYESQTSSVTAISTIVEKGEVNALPKVRHRAGGVERKGRVFESIHDSIQIA